VLNNHERHAAVGRHAPQKLIQRFESAGDGKRRARGRGGSFRVNRWNELFCRRDGARRFFMACEFAFLSVPRSGAMGYSPHIRIQAFARLLFALWMKAIFYEVLWALDRRGRAHELKINQITKGDFS
jgi:hypothetical protein